MRDDINARVSIRATGIAIRLRETCIPAAMKAWAEAEGRGITTSPGDVEARDVEGRALVEALTIEAASRVASTVGAVFGPQGKDDRASVIAVLSERFESALRTVLDGTLPLADVIREADEAEDGEGVAGYEPSADFGEVIRRAAAASRARRAAAEPAEAPDISHPQPAKSPAEQAAADAVLYGTGFVRTTAAGQERIDPATVGKPYEGGPMYDAHERIKSAGAPMPAESIPAPGQVRVHRHDVDGPAPITPPTRIDDGE